MPTAPRCPTPPLYAVFSVKVWSHPPWFGISSRTTLGMLHTPSILKSGSTKVYPRCLSLFFYFFYFSFLYITTLSALMVGFYAKSSKLSYTTNLISLQKCLKVWSHPPWLGISSGITPIDLHGMANANSSN